MKKYPKVRRIGHEENQGIIDSGHLVVQEKLDGANFRFTWDDDEERIVFGSRNVEWWNEKDQANAFEHAIEFVERNVNREQLRTLARKYDEVTVFGEAMHAHTLDYRWDEVPSFLGFDIWLDDGMVGWLDWADVKVLFGSLELPTVPNLYEGPAEDYGEVEIPESEYRDGPAEGIVIRNETFDQTAKHRSEELREKHDAPHPHADDYEPTDSEKLAHKFTTEARVHKLIHKFEDRGRTVEMSLMEDLWREVFDDIIEEEYETIFLGNHELDTQAFRSEVASLTASILERYLSRPDGSVLNQPHEEESEA